MKKKLFAIIIITMFVMTGCNYSQTGIEGLLQPPKLSQQQNDIYSALQASTENNIKLKYPREGEFKSAFLINNIDNEPTEEAIVFYEKTNNAAATMPLKIEVLDQENDEWVSKCTVGVEATEVEKVSFVIANQKTYIVIGFNQINKYEKVVEFYSFNNDVMLEKMYTLRCNDYEVFDINGDGKDEVVTIESKNKNLEVKTVTANAYQISSGGVEQLSQTSMDPNVTDYVKIYKGKLTNGEPALYLDCLKGTTDLSTEILTMSEGELTNLIYSPVEKYDKVETTLRPYGSDVVDLNQDGVYEIPQLKPALGYESKEAHQQINFTEWYNYKGNKLELVKTTYIDYQLGYFFVLPDKWINKVTIENVINEREIIFYDYNAKNPQLNKKLASIKVMEKSDYLNQKTTQGYNIVKENGRLVYLYKIFKTNPKITPTISDIENSFALIP